MFDCVCSFFRHFLTEEIKNVSPPQSSNDVIKSIHFLFNVVNSLCCICRPQWAVNLEMGAVIGGQWEGLLMGTGASTGTGLTTLGTLTTELETINTAGMFSRAKHIQAQEYPFSNIVIRYSRNPNQRLKPWCYVRKEGRIFKEFCDVPKCKSGRRVVVSFPWNLHYM